MYVDEFIYALSYNSNETILPAMKPMSFLRNPWKKKDYKATTHAVDPAQLESEISRTASIISLESDSIIQNDVFGAAHVRKQDWESIQPHVAPMLHRKHGLLFHSSHGPPSLNFSSQSLPSRAPRRPPRPPSLNLSSQPQPPSPRSARVKFAPEPEIRPGSSGSSSRSTFRRIGQPSHKSFSSDLADGGERDGTLEYTIMGPTDSHQVNTHYPSSYRKLASSKSYESLRLFEPATNKSLYNAANSTPHLPLTKVSPQPEFESTSYPDSLHPSQITLASFPQPPPLRIRKRPQPLVLLPTPTIAPLPPSPLVSSSPETTPLATPTGEPQFNPLDSPKNWKFSIRASSTIPPQLHSPPTSPLPSPPTTFVSQMPCRDYSDKPTRVERTVRLAQHTSELHDYQPHHRVTSSTPSRDMFAPSRNAGRQHVRIRPTTADSGLRSFGNSGAPTTSHKIPESAVRWGYAL